MAKLDSYGVLLYPVAVCWCSRHPSSDWRPGVSSSSKAVRVVEGHPSVPVRGHEFATRTTPGTAMDEYQ